MAHWLIDNQGIEVLQRSPLDVVFRGGSGPAAADWYVFLIWAVEKVRTQRASNLPDSTYAILGMAERFIPLGIERLIIPCSSETPGVIFTRVAGVSL